MKKKHIFIAGCVLAVLIGLFQLCWWLSDDVLTEDSFFVALIWIGALIGSIIAFINEIISF